MPLPDPLNLTLRTLPSVPFETRPPTSKLAVLAPLVPSVIERSPPVPEVIAPMPNVTVVVGTNVMVVLPAVLPTMNVLSVDPLVAMLFKRTDTAVAPLPRITGPFEPNMLFDPVIPTMSEIADVVPVFSVPC